MKSEVPEEYLKSFKKFLNCKIDLSKRTFIPRIETEFWLKKALKKLPKLKNQKLKILDVFAGSGCIGIAVLKSVKHCQVDFVDIDERATEQIKINLRLNKISPERYKIYQSNLFEKLKNKKYHLIFANPPYVAKERLKEVQLSVLKYEPKRAILAGKKGLFYIKKFLKAAGRFLKKGGIIFLEFDPLQKNEIENILKKESYKNFSFFKDQFRKFRFLKAEK